MGLTEGKGKRKDHLGLQRLERLNDAPLNDQSIVGDGYSEDHTTRPPFAGN